MLIPSEYEKSFITLGPECNLQEPITAIDFLKFDSGSIDTGSIYMQRSSGKGMRMYVSSIYFGLATGKMNKLPQDNY